MAEDLSLTEQHSDMIGNYLKFAKFQRSKHVRTIENTFEDMKLARLMEGTFSADEICEMLDELSSVLKGDLEGELMNTAHTAALLLCQMCSQAQQWHLKLNADISELENRDMLEKLNKFEEKVSTNSGFDVSSSDSPLKIKRLQPLAENVGATQLLQKEIDRLNNENGKLIDKLKDLEKQTVDILETKCELTNKLAEAERELKKSNHGKEVVFEKDLKYAEEELLQVKQELEATIVSGSYTRQSLENDLDESRRNLKEVQSQLYLAEKELEGKLQQSAAFQNLKQMLSTKNELIKSLRDRLKGYEDQTEED